MSQEILPRERLITLFNKYDSDGNGTLSQVELRRVLCAVGITDDDVNEIFDRVDTNHDGMVSCNEFVNWLYSDSEEAAAVKRESLSEAKNADEALEEFVRFLQQLQELARLTGKDAAGRSIGKNLKLKDIFKTMDMNHNGKISQAEFAQSVRSLGHDCDDEWLKQVFMSIDGSSGKKSKDAQITLKEFKKALEKAGI